MSHSLHHTDAADTAKLLQELDRDSKSRSLTGGYKTAMTVLFVLYSLTMIVMALVVSGATQYTRLPVFVGMTLFVGYLKYPASKRDALRDNYFPWYDVILAFTSLGVFFYYAIEQKRIIQMANRIGTTQIVLGIIGILLLVELCRRSTGIPLIVVVGLFTVYGAWWLTNNNPKTALRNLIYNLFYNLNCGIFSSPITVCASFIVLLSSSAPSWRKPASAPSLWIWQTPSQAPAWAAPPRSPLSPAPWRECIPAPPSPIPSAAAASPSPP